MFVVLMLHMFASNDAFAHKTSLLCRFEGTALHGEGYFSGGSPVKNGVINIYDLKSGKRLVSTVTSDEGTFVVSLENKVPVKVVLDAGQGHRATWTWDGAAEQAESAEHGHTDAENPVIAIGSGLALIAVLFGLLYLWKRRHAA